MENYAQYNNGKIPSLPQDLLQPFSHGWRQPTAEEVRLLLKIANLTGSQAAEIIGSNSRAIRRYTGGERAIHYAEWQLLLIYAGLVKPISIAQNQP